jgi:hypothetical protein
MISHKKGEQWIIEIPFMFSVHAELLCNCIENDDICFFKVKNILRSENKKQFDKYVKSMKKEKVAGHNSSRIIFQKQVKV